MESKYSNEKTHRAEAFRDEWNEEMSTEHEEFRSPAVDEMSVSEVPLRYASDQRLVQHGDNQMKIRLLQRSTPLWPTYLARLAALATLTGAPFAAKAYGYQVKAKEEWGLAFGISACLALLVGNLVMHFFEWLVNAHRDSVETKSRYNFGIMMLTAGVFAVGVATFFVQWQKA